MRPCEVKLDISALHHNLSVINKLAPKSQVVAMVKANAYGHGLVDIAKALESSVAYLAVACIGEAVTLRDAGIKCPILLVEGFFNRRELESIIELDLSTVIHKTWQTEAILATPRQKLIDVWLKHDSGMHRLGLDEVELESSMQVLRQCPWVSNDIKLMSHFACADEPDQTHMLDQFQRFSLVQKRLPTCGVSLANSAAIINFKPSHGQFIRPGIMLYGGSPFADRTAASLNLKPVMTFSSQVIALRKCLKGETVGYGAKWSASQDSLIATIAVGYGDGYPRHLSKEAYTLVNGQQCPIVGRVSMDMLTIDVTHLKHCQIGQEVILWGETLPIEEVANFSNTVNYDLFCRTGLRAFR